MTEDISPFDTLPSDQCYGLWQELPPHISPQRPLTSQEVPVDLFPATNTPSFSSDDWAMSPMVSSDTDNYLGIYALGMEDSIPRMEAPLPAGLGIDICDPEMDIEQDLSLTYAFSPTGHGTVPRQDFSLPNQHANMVLSPPSYRLSLDSRISKRNCKGKTLKLPTPSFAEENEGAGSFLFLNFRKQSAWTRRKNKRK